MNHISKKCWDKFGKSEWAQHTVSSSDPLLDMTNLQDKVTSMTN